MSLNSMSHGYQEYATDDCDCICAIDSVTMASLNNMQDRPLKCGFRFGIGFRFFRPAAASDEIRPLTGLSPQIVQLPSV